MESVVACQDVKLSDHCLAIKPSLLCPPQVQGQAPSSDPFAPFSVFQLGTAAWLSGAFPWAMYLIPPSMKLRSD